jgi:alkylation response protein AidB-like acyl-CoA dehydrogenase
MARSTETTSSTIPKGGAFLVEERPASATFTPEDLTDEHRMIAETAASFVADEVVPLTAELEQKNIPLLVELLGRAGALGLCSVDIPEAYGGLALDKVSTVAVAENVAASSTFAVTHAQHTGIGTLPIVYYGTEAQKQRYLPGLATAELTSAYALTEAGSGSDALAAKTRAVLDESGEHYLLTGEKMWITNGGFADVIVVFAKVDGEHFTAFIVDRDTPGVSYGAEEHKLGLTGSSTVAIRFDNAQVPVENLLGEVGKGHKIAFNILNVGRFKLGAYALGGAKTAMGEAVRYARDRKQFGQPIASFGLIQQKLGEMAIRIYAAESMVYRTAGLVDALAATLDDADGDAALRTFEEYAVECSIVKVWNSEMLGFVVDEEMQIFGGNGYSKDYPAERHYRDARINRVFEGTNEINRLLIPGLLIKRAMKGDLPLMAAAARVVDEMASPASIDELSDGPFDVERRSVGNAKKVALLVAGAAAREFRERLGDEQQVLGHTADIVMQIYAMESGLQRAIKLGESGGARAELAAAMARVLVCDGLEAIDTWAKHALAATLDGDDLHVVLAALRRLTKYSPVNTAALRRTVADRAVEVGRYPL